MKNLTYLTSIFGFAIVLQACSGGAKLAECPAVNMATWASSSHETGPIIEGYGAVHETYIKLERRGTYGVGSDVCQMTRIYCPKPHQDMGCQIYNCDYVEATGALVRVKDYQGTRYYNTPKTAQVIWDGQTLRCGPA